MGKKHQRQQDDYELEEKRYQKELALSRVRARRDLEMSDLRSGASIPSEPQINRHSLSDRIHSCCSFNARICWIIVLVVIGAGVGYVNYRWPWIIDSILGRDSISSGNSTVTP